MLSNHNNDPLTGNLKQAFNTWCDSKPHMILLKLPESNLRRLCCDAFLSGMLHGTRITQQCYNDGLLPLTNTHHHSEGNHHE